MSSISLPEMFLIHFKLDAILPVVIERSPSDINMIGPIAECLNKYKVSFAGTKRIGNVYETV